MNDNLTPNQSLPEPAAAPDPTLPCAPDDTMAPSVNDRSDGNRQTDVDVVGPASQGSGAGPAKAGARKSRRAQARPADVLPLLERLAVLHPQLFGATFRPLKRGIYQDLLAAHGQAFEHDALKAALGFHTRSTRYLSSVAAGQKRHDLQGQAVEDMAPEHVHQALLEVWRRRQGRGAGDDLRARTIARMAQAFEASGMSREDWRERLHGRDEAANAMLDEALAQVASAAARDEALLRAFEASGRTVVEFAGDYGLQRGDAEATLERARKRRALASSEFV